MNKFSRIIALVLALVMVCALAACGSGGSNSDDYEISWWIPVGEDASYYAEYEDNPVLKWIHDNKEFNGKHIQFDFVVGPPGAQADDWSRLVSVGDYMDIMDMSMPSMSVTEMYEEGMIWDLTELVPAHMPNLMKFLEENPQLQDYLYSYVNGEKKILQLRGFADAPTSNFQGFCYRRDWIAKYGTNPQTGAAFTYGYTDPADKLTWYDDVVFPNGTDEPIYISDWEWMFDIFTKALAAEGIEDGYCYSVFYMGYMQTGDLYTGFGGGAPYWYIDGDTIKYGVTEDNMRAYLQCLNTWYNNGWLDKRFDEHTNDMFFAVDTSSVFQGKVGLWQGRTSTVGPQIQAEGTFSEDAMVFGCRQPINDVYGSDAQQNKTPNFMYQYTRYNSPCVLTDKMEEDEVIAILEFVDWLMTEEGWLLGNCGLNAEQVKGYECAFTDTFGISQGYYTAEGEGENLYVTPVIPLSASESPATNLTRISLKYTVVNQVDPGVDRYVMQAYDAWDCYESTAAVPEKVMSSLSTDEAQEITKIRASLDQFQQRTVPQMIKGEAYNVWDDASWSDFVKAINKYRAPRITEIYQTILDSFS